MRLPPRAQVVPVGLLALASSFPLFHSQLANAQSSASGDVQLKVVGVKYLPDKDKIEYKVANQGQSAVTAYIVEISALIRGKYDAWPEGTSRRHDLLSLELGQQCRNPPSTPEDDDDYPWAHVKIPPGIIQTGKERTDSITASGLLPDYLLRGATLELTARVTGVIWADGRIEGTSGIQDMQVIRDDWLEAAREEHDIIAVLKAHPDDGDYQHRINVAIASLQSLIEGYPREVPVPKDERRGTMYLAEPGLVSATIRVLEEAAYLPDPLARFQRYTEFEECAHERRAELQAPAIAVRPGW